MSHLKVSLDGHTVVVSRERYVRLKTKDLKEFGYVHLTEEETDKQVDAVLQKKPFGEGGLTIIGKFMEKEVIEEVA